MLLGYLVGPCHHLLLNLTTALDDPVASFPPQDPCTLLFPLPQMLFLLVTWVPSAHLKPSACGTQFQSLSLESSLSQHSHSAIECLLGS